MPKKLVREPFSVSLISVMEKLFASEGCVMIFDSLSQFFCLTVPKNFVGEPFSAVFHKIFGIEKVYAQEWDGVPTFSVENFLSHGAEEFRGETL